MASLSCGELITTRKCSRCALCNRFSTDRPHLSQRPRTPPEATPPPAATRQAHAHCQVRGRSPLDLSRQQVRFLLIFAAFHHPTSTDQMTTSLFTHTHLLFASRVTEGPGVAQVADRDGARARAAGATGAPEEPTECGESRAAVCAATCKCACEWLFVSLKCSDATQQQQ